MNISNTSKTTFSSFMGMLGILLRGYDANIPETLSQHNFISLSNAFQVRTEFEARNGFPWSPQVK